MEQLSFLTSAPEGGSSRSTTRKAEPRAVTAFTIFIDGASRNNPGKSGAGIYILKNGKPFQEHGHYLGLMTNNQAEYWALVLGIFHITPHLEAGDRLEIVSDSQLLVRQVMGQYKIKNEQLKVLKEHADRMLTGIPYRVRHVLRSDNVDADRLANLGIDEQRPLPPSLRKLLHHGSSTRA